MVRLLGTLCCLLWTAACSASTSEPRVVPTSTHRSLELCLVSGPSINGGSVLQVVVRRTSAVDFEKVTYDDVVATLSQADPETLQWFQILPSQMTARSIDLGSQEEAEGTGDGGSVAVYFLFTEREEPWKALIESGESSASFVLGSHRIEQVDRQRWRCQR